MCACGLWVHLWGIFWVSGTGDWKRLKVLGRPFVKESVEYEEHESAENDIDQLFDDSSACVLPQGPHILVYLEG